MSPSNGCHRRPPDLEFFKFNVDVAWTVDSAGMGALFEIIRDECELLLLVFWNTRTHIT